MPSPNERPWVFPIKAYSYAIDCMRAIQARESIEGDKMHPGWKRQYSYHAFVKALIEQVDQEKQEAMARGNRGVGVMRSISVHKQPDDEEEGAAGE